MSVAPEDQCQTVTKSDEKVQKKKTKTFPGFRENLVDYFSEFSDYTGIHGLKYMGEKDRSLVEKFSWFIFFCVSLYFCTNLIIKAWIKWDTSPVLVSFATSPTPVWKIPFPAITVCTGIKLKRSLFNFTEYYHKSQPAEGDVKYNLTKEEIDTFDRTSLLCDKHLYTKGENFTDSDTIKQIAKLAPTFDELFKSCQWGGENLNCKDIFKPTLTEDGICYTFNMLNISDLLTNKAQFIEGFMVHNFSSQGWSLESGYPKNSNKKSNFPRRVLSAGEKAGLSVVLLQNDTEFDYVCRGPVKGFKVLLHSPQEIPQIHRYYSRAALDQDIAISVTPDMITTSEGLKSYEPSTRQCYFTGERYLQFYKTYTQKNCHVECVANYTLARCGCVFFTMPHNSTTKLCGSSLITCSYTSEVELMKLEVKSALSHFYSAEKQNVSNCNCLPACTSISYNSETSQAPYDWRTDPDVVKNEIVDSTRNQGKRVTRISIFFKEMQFITSQRNELYGSTDFIANCGGLLGLFTGFSFLTIVEILYFLSLRFMCNVKRYGRHYWSGSEDLLKKY